MDEEDMIELLGAMNEDPILGARRSRVPARRGGSARMRQALYKHLVPRSPGVPKPGFREFPLGFEPVQFTDSSNLTLFLVAHPQRPHKGTRLVLDIVRSADGIGGLITVSSFMIGENSQLQSAEPIIAASFDTDSTYVQLSCDPASVGNIITIGITCSVQPTAAATVDVGGALWGSAIG